MAGGNEFEGRIKQYIPDFRVLLEGHIAELWEIKPEELRGKPWNAAKERALNAFCAQNGLNAAVVTLARIEEMERQVGLAPWVGDGGPWVRRDDPDFRPRNPSERRGLK